MGEVMETLDRSTFLPGSVILKVPPVGMLKIGREPLPEPRLWVKWRPDIVWNGLPMVSPGLRRPLSICSIYCSISWILPTLSWASSSLMSIMDPLRGML